MVYGFVIYKNSLKLKPNEINKLQEMINQKAMEIENPMKNSEDYQIVLVGISHNADFYTYLV